MKVLLGCFRMAVWSAIVGRLLEQETGSAGSSRIGGYFHHDGRDHPLHARWLGRIRRRISCNGRETSLPAPYGHYRAAVARRSLPGCHSEQGSAHRNGARLRSVSRFATSFLSLHLRASQQTSSWQRSPPTGASLTVSSSFSRRTSIPSITAFRCPHARCSRRSPRLA